MRTFLFKHEHIIPKNILIDWNKKEKLEDEETNINDVSDEQKNSIKEMTWTPNVMK